MLHTTGNVMLGIGAILFAFTLSTVATSTMRNDVAAVDGLAPIEQAQLVRVAGLQNVPFDTETTLTRQVIAIADVDASNLARARQLRHDLKESYRTAWRVVMIVSVITMVLVGALAIAVKQKYFAHEHDVGPETAP